MQFNIQKFIHFIHNHFSENDLADTNLIILRYKKYINPSTKYEDLKKYISKYNDYLYNDKTHKIYRFEPKFKGFQYEKPLTYKEFENSLPHTKKIHILADNINDTELFILLTTCIKMYHVKKYLNMYYLEFEWKDVHLLKDYNIQYENDGHFYQM